MAAEIIMRLAYGIEVQPKNDPYVDIADSGIRAIEASTNAGSYLVDSFPACECHYCPLRSIDLEGWCTVKHIPEWVPGAGFQRQAKEWRVFATAMLEQPYQYFKKHLVCVIPRLSKPDSTYTHVFSKEEGNVPFCAANVLLERVGKSGQDPQEAESIVKATLSSMYAGKEIFHSKVSILVLTYNYYCRWRGHCQSSVLLLITIRR